MEFSTMPKKWLSLFEKKATEMSQPDIANTMMLVHIEHSKPISVKDFSSTIEAYGNLYAGYLQENGIDYDPEESGLYVEKIEHNCIDIYLCELVQAGLLPFAENMNTIFEFGKNLKGMVEYLTSRKGEEPQYTVSQLKELKSLFDITANDPGGTVNVSVIDKTKPSVVFEQCNFNFNFSESNSAQNQIRNRINKIKEAEPDSQGLYKRVLMVVHQQRNDNSGKGNKAIIDSIIKGKSVNLLFGDDGLRDKILMSDENPAKKAYQVDVEVQKLNNRIVAYKVVALHDIIDLEE